MSLSNWTENKVLNYLLSKAVFTPFTTKYVGLLAANPGEEATGANCNEIPNYPNYNRVSTSPGDWSVSTGGLTTNVVGITFAEALENWGTVMYFGLFDSGVYGGGNLYLYGPITPSRVIVPTSIPRFDIGSLTVILT